MKSTFSGILTFKRFFTMAVSGNCDGRSFCLISFKIQNECFHIVFVRNFFVFKRKKKINYLKSIINRKSMRQIHLVKKCSSSIFMPDFKKKRYKKNYVKKCMFQICFSEQFKVGLVYFVSSNYLKQFGFKVFIE